MAYRGGYPSQTVITSQSSVVDFVSVKHPPNGLTAAKGDGTTDDTVAIQTVINYVGNGGGGDIYFPPGTYMVNAETNLYLKSNMRLVLDSAAVIKAKPASSGSYTILRLNYVSNTEICGGKIVGDRNEHTAPIDGKDWGFGLCITNSQNIRIVDTEIKDCWGDGIYVSNVNGLRVDRTPITNSRRNGISIICGDNIDITDSAITATQGASPECAIDIEPNYDNETVGRITIDNCVFKGNGEGPTVQLNTKTTTVCTPNIKFTNCTLEDTISILNFRDNVKGQVIVDKCKSLGKMFLGCTNVTDATKITVSNCESRNWTNVGTEYWYASVYFMFLNDGFSGNMGNVVFENNKFENDVLAQTAIYFNDLRPTPQKITSVQVNNCKSNSTFLCFINPQETLNKFASVELYNSYPKHDLQYEYKHHRYNINNTTHPLWIPDGGATNEMIVEAADVFSSSDSLTLAYFYYKNGAWNVTSLGKYNFSNNSPELLISGGAPSIKNSAASTRNYVTRTTVLSSGAQKLIGLRPLALSLASSYYCITSGRPSNPLIGQQCFDTTISKPIWFNGTTWVDSTGSTV